MKIGYTISLKTSHDDLHANSRKLRRSLTSIVMSCPLVVVAALMLLNCALLHVCDV